MISFIVPAHNEQACLGRTLRAIHESACAVGQPYEIIVVGDASTDATAEILSQRAPAKMGLIGIQDTFTESGAYDALLCKYGISVDRIESEALRLLAPE